MAGKKVFSVLYLLAFLAVIFCDIAPLVSDIEIPALLSTVLHIVLTVTMVLMLGFKGFVKFLLALVLMYVLYVLLTGSLMLLGLTYELADLIGTIISVAFIIIVSAKI